MAVVATNKNEKIDTWLSRPEIQERIAGALGGSMAVNEFIAQILIEFQKPEFAECTPESKFKAVHLCAQLTLLPTFNEVAIIPYGKELKAMIQWQGMHAIMMRHPDVEDVEVRLVFKGDTFAFDGTRHVVTRHEYDPFDNREVKKDLSNLKGGYLIITFANGRRKFHLTNAEYIRKCRACAHSKNVWDGWTTQQCLKTICRDAFARRVAPTNTAITKYMNSVLDEEDRIHNNRPDLVIEHRPIESMVHQLETSQQEPETNGQQEQVESESEQVTIEDAAHIRLNKCRSPDDVNDVTKDLLEQTDDENERIAIGKLAGERIKELMAEIDRLQQGD